MTPTEDRTDRKIHRPQSIVNHKRDFVRFRVDCTNTQGDVFWTPIRGCDIFRKAMAGHRFFGVSKKTPRGTRATPDLAKQERRAPRPAVQNVAETRPKIAPTRPADAARLAKAMPACAKTRPTDRPEAGTPTRALPVAKRGALARTLPIAQRGTPPVLLFYFALPLLLRPSRRASVLSPSRSGGLVTDQ